MKRLHRSEFIRELKLTFPELIAEVNRQYGLLHFEVAVFRRHTQHAINNGNTSLVLLAFKLAERYLVLGNRTLQNALAVSYVEDLEFRDQKFPRLWAWHLLPAPLKKVYEAFHIKPVS